jgi:hypothetical protein
MAKGNNQKKGFKIKPVAAPVEASPPLEAAPPMEPSDMDKLEARVDHLLQTRGCHVLAYPTGCPDPMAIMALRYSKSGKHRKLDLWVFEGSETAERKSSIKAFLGSTADDKGNYYIDKVPPATFLPFFD